LAEIAVLESRDKEALKPALFNPLDLITIVRLVIAGLTAAGVLIGLRTLARRRAGRALAAAGRRELAERVADPAATRVIGSVTVEQTEQHLTAVLARHPELSRLMRAQRLNHEALQREVLAALEEWEGAGRLVQQVENGAVQRLTKTPGNYMSLQGNTLQIEKQVLDQSRTLHVWQREGGNSCPSPLRGE
jgi:chromosome segregation ATPase